MDKSHRHRRPLWTEWGNLVHKREDMTPKKPKQTLTGLIRCRVAEYQARQLAGETQKTFAEELTAAGHPINYADFRKLYSRARKQLLVTPVATTMPAPFPAAAPTKVPPKHAPVVTTKCTGYVHRDMSSFRDDELI